MELSFEQGPIRPPSEAKSLLIRITRSCPWNRCAFCHTYRGQGFEIREVSDIKRDITTVKTVAQELQNLSRRQGRAGAITEEAIQALIGKGYPPAAVMTTASWLYHGGETVFLQDADSLVIKTDSLAKILVFLKETFPQITRITSYCRSGTAGRKPLADLIALREAGLSRLHVGMESGFDPLLAFIDKGATKARHIEAGRKIKEAGLSLCEYVMPGLGGTDWSADHARHTAEALNEINPDHIRLRSLFIVEDSNLYALRQEGRFNPLDDEGIVREIRILLDSLAGIDSSIISDHILNLLEEIEGRLPEDKGRLLGIIDGFLALPADDRLVFQLGRRLGRYRRLADLAEPATYRSLKRCLADAGISETSQLQKYLSSLMQGFV